MTMDHFIMSSTPLEESFHSPLFDTNSVGNYAEKFKEHQLLIIDNFLNPDYVQENFIEKTLQCESFMHRVKIPNFKKSGSVSSQRLKIHAPELFNLYHSAQMKQFIENVVGEKLMVCPEEDPHSVALYYYTEPGDHIGVHYDKSFYKGRRYTVLLGLIQDSEHSKLVCYLGANKLNRRKNPLSVMTHPGTLVIFNGDTLWHEVTPLAENEKRVILTMEYVTNNKMTALNRFVSTTKDRLLYFGKSSGKKES